MLDFVRANFAPMAAAMCLVGHIADDLDTYAMYERLLALPKEDVLEDMFRGSCATICCLQRTRMYPSAWASKPLVSGLISSMSICV